MKEKILDYFNRNKQKMLNCIAQLVAIDSVRGEPQDGMPFSEKPYAAIQAALATAEEFGFKTQNHDGYVGTVDMNDGDEKLAILAHLDVVPAGDGWHSDPFKMLTLPDRIIGRGVSDDKGPAVCALFAMKAVRDLGLDISKNCRLILGSDEECGSSDLSYYFSKNKPAEFSFTPDANFPVTNGEKGRFAKKFQKNVDASDDRKRLVSLNGGTTVNAVPSFAEAEVSGADSGELLAAIEKARSTGCDFTVDGGKIICSGVSAHASLPENGNNPITALIQMLSYLDLDGASGELISSLAALFPHGKYNGEALGVDMSDRLGRLTLTLDIISFDGNRFEGCFDSRTPLCATEDNCSSVVKARLAEHGFTLENTAMRPPHYVDESSEFVQTLLTSYERFSGDSGECISMGGGTYVHDIENGVAFGAISRDTQTNMHGADEFMLIDDLITSAAIFTDVIYRLCK